MRPRELICLILIKVDKSIVLSNKEAIIHVATCEHFKYG